MKETDEVMELLESKREWTIEPAKGGVRKFGNAVIIEKENPEDKGIIVAIVCHEPDARILVHALELTRACLAGLDPEEPVSTLLGAADEVVSKLWPDYCPYCAVRWEIHDMESCKEENPRPCPACGGKGVHDSGCPEDPDNPDNVNDQVYLAAPELLEALEAAEAALRSYQYGNNAPDLAKEVADKAQAAIAKARGNKDEP